MPAVSNHWRVVGLLGVVAVISFAIFIFYPPQSTVAQQNCSNNQYNVSGYAWSSNIGWIQFKGMTQGANPNCYGVHFQSQQPPALNGSFSGYAWSSNIGWIRFDPVIGLIGGPNGDDLPAQATLPSAHGVQLESDGITVTGWARACSVFEDQSQCSGTLKDDSTRGGWDGWISMSGSAGGGTYGVTYSDGKLSSFAWGDTNVGWVDFCNDSTEAGADHCVSIDNVAVACRTTNTAGVSETNFVLDPNLSPPSVDVVWEVVSPTSQNYKYDWSWSDGNQQTLTLGESPSPVTKTYTAVVPVTGVITITDPSAPDPTRILGQNQCVIDIQTAGKKNLTVQIAGDGEATQYGRVTTTVSPAVPNNVCDKNDNYTCDYELDTDTAVDLSAEVVSPPVDGGGNPYITFAGWDIGVTPTSGCDGVNPSCLFSMTQGVIVTARFNDSRMSASATFTVPNDIVISSHISGSPITSPPSMFQVTINGNADVNICVSSVEPKPGTVLYDRNGQPTTESFSSIESIVSWVRENFQPSDTPGAGSEYEFPDCLLSIGNNSVVGSCGGDPSRPQSCVTVPSGTVNAPAWFKIKVFDRLPEIKLGLPYKVNISASAPGSGSTSLHFFYNVQNITPR